MFTYNSDSCYCLFLMMCLICITLVPLISVHNVLYKVSSWGNFYTFCHKILHSLIRCLWLLPLSFLCDSQSFLFCFILSGEWPFITKCIHHGCQLSTHVLTTITDISWQQSHPSYWLKKRKCYNLWCERVICLETVIESESLWVLVWKSGCLDKSIR